MRRFVADTFALIVFSSVGAGLVEWLVAGLSPAQMLQTRLATIPVIIATARPYGIYRDWVFRSLARAARREFGRAALDIVAFVSFQAPVYAAILFAAGAELRQIALAVSTSVVAMALAGRPYGLFLQFVRRMFGVPAIAA
ncbi:MAG: L-alanine exporter AlaE [Pseudomonadota bacterium]|nr:L-alanine exporter AlaE [Pseudomonadota bacterium]